MVKWLCVAEKPSIAKAITQILSGGQFQTVRLPASLSFALNSQADAVFHLQTARCTEPEMDQELLVFVPHRPRRRSHRLYRDGGRGPLDQQRLRGSVPQVAQLRSGSVVRRGSQDLRDTGELQACLETETPVLKR